MPLGPGARLGPYEIQSAIGAGGMGEVYRATDTNLKRSVAIKVLPESVAADRERLARFQREAEVLASLNHPNIAQVHGLEKSGGTTALVMELVEGPTLADRITRGPIPVDEALPIAKQIAEALETAHEQGIIHRDLKPANIKLRPDGTVKVLDFGLAKAIEASAMAIDATASPTITSPAMTGLGVLLGTAAYMSPEQARGKAVDKRSDIWSFGCVLYEMLTGKRAFRGETVQETLAEVMKSEPLWTALSPETPTALRNIVRRCLEKDPRQRTRDIGDVRIGMQDAQEEVASATTPLAAPVVTRRRGRLAWAVAAVVIVSAGVGASVSYFRRPPAEAPPVRFTVGPPEGGSFNPNSTFLTLSPDGSKLAFIAAGPSGTSQLWIRALDSLTAQPLPGSERAFLPFWSPDSRFLAFYADGSVKKIAVSGGPPQTLTTGAPGGIGGGTWSQEGVVLFGMFPPATNGIQRVSAAGGTATPVTTLDASRQENAHLWPHFLPDNRHFLYFARTNRAESGAIYVGSLDSQERTLLLNASSNAVYVPPGYLLYHRAGTLTAQPFDAQRIRLMGEPVPIAEGLQVTELIGHGAFSASENGVLAYRAGTDVLGRTLVWVSRDGTEQPLAAPERAYDYPRLSPDGGGRIAVEIGPQIWVYDLTRDTLTRLTFEEGSVSENPIWSPDGKRILFDSSVPGAVGQGSARGIFWQMADGSGGLERLSTSDYQQTTRSWSSDGQLVALNQLHPTTQRDIWVLRLNDREARPFLVTRFNEGAPQFSPDGRWLTYVSDESGGPEIYVQPYPGPGGKWQISTDGGTEPMWSPSGRELFYRRGARMMAVDVTAQPAFSAGKPRMLFERQYVSTPFPQTFPRYDVSPDGQRFLILKQGESGPTQINVVQNWIGELKRLVPTP